MSNNSNRFALEMICLKKRGSVISALKFEICLKQKVQIRDVVAVAVVDLVAVVALKNFFKHLEIYFEVELVKGVCFNLCFYKS